MNEVELGRLEQVHARVGSKPHLLNGVILLDLITIDLLIQRHCVFLKSFLGSCVMRDFGVTVRIFLLKLGLKYKVRIHNIRYLADDVCGESFTLMQKSYGRNTSVNIYIVHSGLHFFLADPV